MSTKKPRLGRGLDALLGGSLDTTANARDELRHLPVDLLLRGKYQPRTHMNPEALEDLANSIRAQGVVQPIVVRPLSGGQYEIIAGERRWRASQMAGLDTIPAVVRDIPDEAAIAIALIENIQREDLNPVEEALALQRLIDEFGMTHQQTAESVGRSRAAVTNLLRLLALNDDVRQMLEEGKMDMGHARALLALPAADQVMAAQEISAKKLSVREAERLVARSVSQREEGPVRAKPAKSRDLTRLEERLADLLTAEVEIRLHRRTKRGDQGEIAIRFDTLDELSGLLDKLGANDR